MNRELSRRLRAIEAAKPKRLVKWVHVTELTDDDHAFISDYCNRMLDTGEVAAEERIRLAAIFDRITYPERPAGSNDADWMRL